MGYYPEHGETQNVKRSQKCEYFHEFLWLRFDYSQCCGNAKSEVPEHEYSHKAIDDPNVGIELMKMEYGFFIIKTKCTNDTIRYH